MPLQRFDTALARLRICDETRGWTVVMQVRAARIGLRVRDVEVCLARRTGPPKISGTRRAGWKIPWLIGAEALDGPARIAASCVTSPSSPS